MLIKQSLAGPGLSMRRPGQNSVLGHNGASPSVNRGGEKLITVKPG